MTDFSVPSRTILLVLHGSRAYGLATPESDTDVKGVCIPPREYHLGFNKTFEQEVQMAADGHPEDKTIFSLKKFAKLAANSNPNFLEVLFGDDADILQIHPLGEGLRSQRDHFLSLKAHDTFLGFARSERKHLELKRIHTSYDHKGASHLIRLLRMAVEIVRDGKVIVKRPDRQELLAIKLGRVPYEHVIQEADFLEAQCKNCYDTSPLPKTPNLALLDQLVVNLTSSYLSTYG